MVVAKKALFTLFLMVALAFNYGKSNVVNKISFRENICKEASISTGKELIPITGGQNRTSKWKAITKPVHRIYDCFVFRDELDMLEIRLNELNDVIDYFVIVESPKTFGGKDKRLYFNETQTRFIMFSHKIIHLIVEDVPTKGGSWVKEAHMKNSLLRGLHADNSKVRDGDIVLISDLDEIPRPRLVISLKLCTGYDGTHIKFQTRFSYYSYSWIVTEGSGDQPWGYPDAFIYNSSVNVNVGKTQINHKKTTLLFKNGGWCGTIPGLRPIGRSPDIIHPDLCPIDPLD
jgi:hypothetical protein